MTLAETSQPFILTREDGSQLSFKRVTAGDRFKYRNTFRAYRTAYFVHGLKILGMNGMDAVRAMNEVAMRRVTEDDVVEWANDLDGQREAALASLQVDKPDAKMEDVDALSLTDREYMEVAGGVLGLRVVQKNAGAAANPTGAGPTPAETTGTGSEKPAPSPTGSEPPPATP